MFNGDLDRALSPRQASLLTVAVLDLAGQNAQMRRDWTAMLLSADAVAQRLGCSHRPAANDLKALCAVGALRTVTVPRPGMVTR